MWKHFDMPALKFDTRKRLRIRAATNTIRPEVITAIIYRVAAESKRTISRWRWSDRISISSSSSISTRKSIFTSIRRRTIATQLTISNNNNSSTIRVRWPKPIIPTLNLLTRTTTYRMDFSRPADSRILRTAHPKSIRFSIRLVQIRCCTKVSVACASGRRPHYFVLSRIFTGDPTLTSTIPNRHYSTLSQHQIYDTGSIPSSSPGPQVYTTFCKQEHPFFPSGPPIEYSTVCLNCQLQIPLLLSKRQVLFLPICN